MCASFGNRLGSSLPRSLHSNCVACTFRASLQYSKNYIADFEKLIEIVRLQEVMRSTKRERLLPIFGMRRGSNDNNRGRAAGAAASQPFHYFQPARFGHVQVQKHDVRT